MAAPIYRGGRPFIKPGIRTGNNTGIFNVSGSPVDGTSGTLRGIAGPGSILMSTSGVAYYNSNTKASPTWVALSGSAAAAITSGTITGATLSGNIYSDTKPLAASITYDANVTPALITGFAWTVVAGATYQFDVELATTMTTNAGLTIAFKLTTATLTSIRYNTYAATASDNTTAVSTTGTTTTDLTEPFNSKAGAYTRVRVFGSMVVNAGGTFSWYGCQETSGTAGDVTLLLIGSTARMTRIA
jgi:hypothetical protein